MEYVFLLLLEELSSLHLSALSLPCSQFCGGKPVSEDRLCENSSRRTRPKGSIYDSDTIYDFDTTCIQGSHHSEEFLLEPMKISDNEIIDTN
jgi:hypothetical protein